VLSPEVILSNSSQSYPSSPTRLKGFLIIVCLVLAGAATVQPQSSHSGIEHHVLVVHSYHAGYPWTDDIQRAVVDTLGDRADTELHVEYLDLIRNTGPGHWSFLKELLQRKYGGNDISFDLVLVSDDRGLDLVLEERSRLFPGVPVVFSGINDFSGERTTGDGPVLGVTGMDDTDVIGETIDLAVDLNPSARQIAVVSGSRPSEALQYRSFREAMETRRLDIEVANLNGLDEGVLIDRLCSFGTETVVLYLSYLLSPSGRSYDYRDALRMVVENTESMVFVTTDFLVRDGVVGGRVVDGYAQGRDASLIALRLLDGEDPDTIPVQRAGNTRYLFDDRALQRFGISDEDLPDRSVLTNRSPQRMIENPLDDGTGLFAEGSLFDMHGAVMLLVDSESGIIVAANDAAYDFYGYPQLAGKSINTINTLSPEETAAERLSAQLERKNYFAFRHRLSDGSVRDVAVYSYPVQIQETDLLFSVVFDRTEQLAAQQDRERQTKIIIMVLAFLFVIAAFTLLLLLKLFHQTRMAENALRKHLRIRNSLMLEVQHRTKNNMQVIAGLISLQAAFSDNPELSEAYSRLHRRVATIAMAHHQLTGDNNVSYVDLSAYIHGIVDEAISEAGDPESRLRRRVDIANIDVLIDIAIPCGLIVNELITSSVRHRTDTDTPRAIHLEIREQNADTLELTYSDTAPSPVEKGPPDGESELSTMLVRNIAEHQLGGSFVRTQKPGNGTETTIRISRQVYKDRIPGENEEG
jgi:PAS domain S-box-containing protein